MDSDGGAIHLCNNMLHPTAVGFNFRVFFSFIYLACEMMALTITNAVCCIPENLATWSMAILSVFTVGSNRKEILVFKNRKQSAPARIGT
jgi:hypothetical protein